MQDTIGLLKPFEFYSNHGIKVIDRPPYSPDLNQIEHIWAFMKKQLEGKRFATMNQLKNEQYEFGKVLMRA